VALHIIFNTYRRYVVYVNHKNVKFKKKINASGLKMRCDILI